MFRLRLILSYLLLLGLLSSCSASEKDHMTEEFKAFVKKFEARIIPLHKLAMQTYFDATISGKEEDYDRAADLEVQLNRIFANKQDFEILKRFREANAISDPMLRRQLDVLYLAYLEKQLDEDKLEKMIRLQNKNEKMFSTYRAEVNGKKLTDNEIDEILRCAITNLELKAA